MTQNRWEAQASVHMSFHCYSPKWIIIEYNKSEYNPGENLAKSTLRLDHVAGCNSMGFMGLSSNFTGAGAFLCRVSAPFQTKVENGSKPILKPFVKSTVVAGGPVQKQTQALLSKRT